MVTEADLELLDKRYKNALKARETVRDKPWAFNYWTIVCNAIARRSKADCW